MNGFAAGERAEGGRGEEEQSLDARGERTEGGEVHSGGCVPGGEEREGRPEEEGAARADRSESRDRWRMVLMHPFEMGGASGSQRVAGGGRDGRGHTQGKNGRQVEEGGTSSGSRRKL